ncbi:MAG: PD40 domain-containing protein [Muribaculaceae bacterium]|nr:PD40 domain-containing protein [Muribaculaceae bacterium]
MKKFLLLSAIVLSQVCVAQNLKVGQLSNVTRLTQDGVKYENPRWSPDGSKIAFTEYGYNNLFVINQNGTNKAQISSDKGVGFMYQWSADSREILVRDLRYENVSGQIKRLQAAWSIDMAGNKTRMTEDVTRMEPAAWRYGINGEKTVISLDAKTTTQSTRYLTKSLATTVAKQAGANISLIVNKEGLSVVNARGVKTLINNKPSFCPALSPDGSKIVFNELNDIYIINIDGSGKKLLARGFNPTWANDSQIIFEKSTDDGHNYTSSDLYIINANGSGLKAITATSDKMEMCPCVSPDGNKIVFTSFTDGQIYTADLK